MKISRSPSDRIDQRGIARCASAIACASLTLALFLVSFLSTPSTYARESSSLHPTEILFYGVLGAEDELGLNPSRVLSTSIEVPLPESAGLLASPMVDLVQYMRNNVDPRPREEIQDGLPRYNRLGMFGGWVNDNPKEDCYNTRVEVLIRDADDPKTLVFTRGNSCNLAKGSWHDPYSGGVYKLASAVQVDHFVPLKEAYLSGAHSWTKERRCHYTNYRENSYHLLTVSGHENMSKGGAGPTDYLPPNEAYVCQYLSQWMKLKAIWNLQYTGEEQRLIEREFSARECASDLARMDATEFDQQRTKTTEISAGCR